MTELLTIGLVAPRCVGSSRKVWNDALREKGIPAFFDFYRTTTIRDLELRLSQMFLHDRRGYIVDPLFSSSILPLLDRLDDQAITHGAVDTVLNDGGILVGYFFGAGPQNLYLEQRFSLFFPA